MSDYPDAALWLALKYTLKYQDKAFVNLLKTFGVPAQIYAASLHELKQVVGEKLALEVIQGVRPERIAPALDWLAEPNNHLVTLVDDTYPPPLLAAGGVPPPVLFAKGHVACLNRPCFAIVGSRQVTPQGKKHAHDFAYQLAQHGLCIVSGLALGIDGAAHRGALHTPAGTIAVVATGLDLVYPPRHRDLAHDIVANDGLIVSEFLLGEASKPQNFPRRNRIISGLSMGVLVVEANLHSGSLITARQAAEQGREVFAIPGSILSPLSKGCHQLIKQGAKLTDCVEDILEEFALNIDITPQKSASIEASEAELAHPLLRFMSFDPIGLEELVQQTGLASGEVSALLMTLELEGKVAIVSGSKYQRLV